MGSRRSWLRRLSRVLELAEQVLAERVGEPLLAEDFERNLAFRWEAHGTRGRLAPIEDPDLFDLEDLLGVEGPVGRLVANAEQFVAGHPANNVLLYGDRGTGKSSAVKGLLGRLGGRGLRIVEIHKDDLFDLPRVLETLRGVDYRFLLFCDDLSFDAGESRYRELKAALEGSLVAPPENVRIIATSNRRHLVSESNADNREAHLDASGELRMGEAVDEKLALSDRFGLVLGFYGFDQDTYLSIVEHYVRKAGVQGDWSSLRAEALRWALDRGGRSGRVARQFADDVAGREALERSHSGGAPSPHPAPTGSSPRAT